jgi:hypothetical protein
MTKVDTMPGYQSPWLRPEDLRGSSVKVTIERVTVQVMRNFEGEPEEKLVVHFMAKTKVLALNRGQAATLVHLFGNETDDWAGREILLSPAPSRQPGKLTIAVSGMPREPEPDGRDGLPF